MRPAFALLHGDPWVVLFLPVALGIAAIFLGVVLFVVWLFFTRLPAYYPPAAYFIFAACLVAPTILGSATTVPGLMFTTSIILTLPWNIVLGEALSPVASSKASDSVFAFMNLLGAVINAFIIFGIGTAGRYLLNKRLDRTERHLD